MWPRRPANSTTWPSASAGDGGWSGTARSRNCSPAITSRPASISARCWTPSPGNWRPRWRWPRPPNWPVAPTNTCTTKRCGTPTTGGFRRPSGWPGRRRGEGDGGGAVRTLDEVPATSRHFATARLTSAVTLLSGRSASEITEEQIRDAARRVEALPPTEPRVLQIRALVLGSALDWLQGNEASTNHILGFPFTEHGLRLGGWGALRGLARAAPTQAHRYTLVDMANRVRPTSTF